MTAKRLDRRRFLVGAAVGFGGLAAACDNETVHRQPFEWRQPTRTEFSGITEFSEGLVTLGFASTVVPNCQPSIHKKADHIDKR